MKTKHVRYLFSVVLALWASALSAQSHWTCDINAYQYDMTVYYDLQTNGTAVADWGNFEVAAFVGDECRGVGETMAAIVNEATVHYGYLRVRSNASAGGETVSFKVYVKNANKEVAIGSDANITFTPNGAEGLPSSPKVFNISVYQLSFPATIVGGTVYGAGSYYVGSQATARAVADNYYTFTKWIDDAGVAIMDNPYTVTMTKDLTLSPVFTPVSFTISYDLKGGALADGITNPTNYTIESEDFTLNNPTKYGYDFLGWTGTDLTAPTLQVTVVKGSYDNRSYTAQWQPIAYPITYDLAGGTVELDNPENYTIESETFTLTNPTRKGYTFAGWTGTGIDGKAMTVTISKGSSGPLAYTATWTPITYTITYDLDGGMWREGYATNPTSYTIETEAIYLVNPRKSGFSFAGWTGTGLTEPTFMVSIPKGSTGDYSFKATWSDQLLMGDVNGDGIISAVDANLCVEYLLNGSAPDFNADAADMDKNGSVTEADVTAIINKILNP